jgi:hypothetical protein
MINDDAIRKDDKEDQQGRRKQRYPREWSGGEERAGLGCSAIARLIKSPEEV